MSLGTFPHLHPVPLQFGVGSVRYSQRLEGMALEQSDKLPWRSSTSRWRPLVQKRQSSKSYQRTQLNEVLFAARGSRTMMDAYSVYLNNVMSWFRWVMKHTFIAAITTRSFAANSLMTDSRSFADFWARFGSILLVSRRILNVQLVDLHLDANT